MFSSIILFVAFITLASGSAPPYVQSREAFGHVKNYLSQQLTPDVSSIHDPITRQHYSFGIIAGVTAELVLADRNHSHYDPLLVLEKSLPYAWRNYKKISSQTQAILNDASQKVRPVTDFVDIICEQESIEVCNNEIHTKVTSNPRAYKLSAELLLQLGKVSETIRSLEGRLNYVTQNRYEIPYLIDNVNTQSAKNLVTDLRIVYDILQRVQFRRYNADME